MIEMRYVKLPSGSLRLQYRYYIETAVLTGVERWSEWTDVPVVKL